jgi:hypothetical protein
MKASLAEWGAVVVNECASILFESVRWDIGATEWLQECTDDMRYMLYRIQEKLTYLSKPIQQQ